MDMQETVRQLADEGWHIAAATLERDCGIQVVDLYNSLELRRIRDLVVDGQWQHVRICLEPFAQLLPVQDWNQLSYFISRQQLLELLGSEPDNPSVRNDGNTSHQAMCLAQLLKELKAYSPEYCAQFLNEENVVPLPADWSVSKGRNTCLRTIFDALKHVLRSHERTTLELAFAKEKECNKLEATTLLRNHESSYKWNVYGNLEDTSPAAEMDHRCSPRSAPLADVEQAKDAQLRSMNVNQIKHEHPAALPTKQPDKPVFVPRQARERDQRIQQRSVIDAGANGDVVSTTYNQRQSASQLHGNINYHYATHTAECPPYVDLVNRTQSAPRHHHHRKDPCNATEEVVEGISNSGATHERAADTALRFSSGNGNQAQFQRGTMANTRARTHVDESLISKHIRFESKQESLSANSTGKSSGPAIPNRTDVRGTPTSNTATFIDKSPSSPPSPTRHMSQTRTRFHKTVSIPGAEMDEIPEFCSVGRLVDTHAVRCVAFDVSGRLLAVGSNASVLRVCPVAPTRELQSLWRSDAAMAAIDDIPVAWQQERHHAGSLYSLAWNPRGDLIASGSNDKTVKLQGFDAAACIGREVTTLRPHCGTIRDVAFCAGAHGAECIAVGGGNDFGVVVYDCASAAKMSHLRGHADQVATIVSSASGRTIFSGSADRTVRVWDLRSARSVRTLPAFHCGVASVAVVGDDASGMLAVGLTDGTVAVLDVKEGTQIHTVLGHSAEVKSLEFGPGAHGHWLLSGSYDGQANIVSLHKHCGEQVEFQTCGAHDDKIVTARWRPPPTDGYRQGLLDELAFATCGADRMVKLWVAQSTSASIGFQQW
eukprot:m.495620 g.495620  ORF g.495620 m.495620 type:complete len:826 (-) comp21802_c0_seq2:378-2855(-)